MSVVSTFEKLDVVIIAFHFFECCLDSSQHIVFFLFCHVFIPFELICFKWCVLEVAYQHRLDEAVVGASGPDVENDIHRFAEKVD